MLNNQLDADNYDRAIEQHLHKEYPHLVERYRESIKTAEKMVLRQLIQAILREKIIESSWTEHAAVIRLSEEEQIEVPIEKKYTLGQIDIVGNITYTDRKGNKSKLTSPDQLLRLMIVNGNTLTFDNMEQFCKEITNSTYNFALALTIAEHRKQQDNTDAQILEATDSFDYVLKKAEEDPHFSPLNFFEQWVIQGHTIHPCSRTRLGLSPEDITKYAPEWEGRPNVIPVAVHKEFCRLTHIEKSVTQILLEEYPEVEQAFDNVLTKKQLNKEDYELIPVHPWQLENTVHGYYQEEIQNDVILTLDQVSIETAALVSFRSLAPLKSKLNHHIKTAMNVQMTSAVRTVSAASTYNGPKITSVLQKIRTEDPLIANTLSFMREDAGIHFEPKTPIDAEERHFLQKNVASILRENPEKTLSEGEVALPAAALIAESPVSGQLVMEELIRQHAKREDLPLSEAAVDYMEQYVNVLLPGVIALMTKYGISMEVHMQNCVAVFRKGRPERVIVRDNGGIRIMESRLNNYMALKDLDNSTNLKTSKREELLDIFFHAIIHNHLGEIIVPLARNFEIDEHLLWNPVRKVVKEVFAALKRDASIPADNLRDEAYILADKSSMKALVQMRLTDKFTENAYVDVANPLFIKNEVFPK